MRVLLSFPPTPRAHSLTYHNFWTLAGYSGTEAALMEIGRAWTARGVHVCVVGTLHASDAVPYTDDRPPGGSGVAFAREQDVDVNDFDWFCPLEFASPWDPLGRRLLAAIRDPRKTKLLLWLHCFPKNPEVIAEWRRAGLDVYGMAVSQWVLDQYAPLLPTDRLALVPNGVAPRFWNDDDGAAALESQRVRGRWCFTATFERGGAKAQRVFQRVRALRPEAAQSFHFMTYYTPDLTGANAGAIRCRGSLSKTALAAELAQAEYFVYPLVLPNGKVHFDTFACCILEALARGVLVVTWAVACIPSLYGDRVVALPPPPETAACQHHPWFSSAAAEDALVAAVLDLDADPARKERLRREGAQWARQQTWDAGARASLALLGAPPPPPRRRTCRLAAAPAVPAAPAPAPAPA